MSSCNDKSSPDTNFWLEFRTFDDGLAPESSTPSSFSSSLPKFGLLPPELRLKIWEYLIQPRVTVACCLQRDDKLSLRRQELSSRTRGAQVPVLLHINRETRDLALKHYDLTFSWRASKLPSGPSIAQPARVYFNFATDALFLTGDLEIFDTYGFNSPMVYFLRKEETSRVKHIACAFRELGYPEQSSDRIFSSLWHVVDRFPAVERLLLSVREEDDEEVGMRGTLAMEGEANVVQKIWRGWISGTTVTSGTMKDKQMLLVRENGLGDFVRSHQI